MGSFVSKGQGAYKSSFSPLSSTEKGALGYVTGTPSESLITGCFETLEDRLHNNAIHFLPGLYNTRNTFTAFNVFCFSEKQCRTKVRRVLNFWTWTCVIWWLVRGHTNQSQSWTRHPPVLQLCFWAITEKGNIKAFFSPCKREKNGGRGNYLNTPHSYCNHCIVFPVETPCWFLNPFKPTRHLYGPDPRIITEPFTFYI